MWIWIWILLPPINYTYTETKHLQIKTLLLLCHALQTKTIYDSEWESVSLFRHEKTTKSTVESTTHVNYVALHRLSYYPGSGKNKIWTRKNCCQIRTKATRVFRALWTPVFAFSNEAFASSLSPCVSCLMRDADVLCPVNISVRSSTGIHSVPSRGFFTILRPSLSLTYFLRSASDLNWIFLGLLAGSSKKDLRSTKLETWPSRWIHGKYGRSGGKLEPSTKTKRPTHQESESQETRLLKTWVKNKWLTMTRLPSFQNPFQSC